ncbi:GRIP domain-containing protein [Caenorhabditis elegans]|uniref:GRIP domain-containing protein n=1 Tax=Caenorhabditis elegans TaxID=6239 RepID=Q18013_CAEEL|nr:GRIP domain-containing protein [Caenorhabditis elegans]CCD64587.1 GRIP domain-containing protein [Caenorhabditis elegans]|eukprot:NP_508543.2 Grip (GRIP) and Coiled-Coil domain containing protein related [Caenorhabditis elegans]
MSSMEKLTSDLQAERQKLALYEKNLRVAVESCKALKAEKENLANIIAGFACAEVKPGSTDINDLKQKIAVLTKEFQGKESALVLARNSVLKENQELKKRLAEAESVPNSLATSRNGDCSFHVAELEQKLRKEMSLTRKYEQRLQQLESQLKNNSASDSKMELANKQLEAEREQFKKLYEDAHGRSIFLERKFTSLQLDQKRDEAETPKVVAAVEDDIKIAKLENQIMNLSKRCDDKEDELSELSSIITQIKGENMVLKESLEQLEKKRSLSPVDEFWFRDGMSDEYEKFKKDNGNPLEFCCPTLRDDVLTLIDKAVEDNARSDQVKQQQIQITNLERTIRVLNDKINCNDVFRSDVEEKLDKLKDDISSREREINAQKEEVNRIKDSLRLEKSKRNELEEEVLRQRRCAQEEIESRDQEIEAFRKMLVTLRHEKMERSQNPRKISRHNRSSAHDEESARRRSRTFSQDDTAVPNDPDSKNVYYENQLSKKDYDIQELRRQLMDVEIRLRENESVSMSRQLESVAHNEEMTEKVRVLEGKLQMLSSTSEIDYLRNIFTQFLHSMGSPNAASKAILKAMGSVLKVPMAEMKIIDKK